MSTLPGQTPGSSETEKRNFPKKQLSENKQGIVLLFHMSVLSEDVHLYVAKVFQIFQDITKGTSLDVR